MWCPEDSAVRFDVNSMLLSKELRSCSCKYGKLVYMLHELGTVGLGIGTGWNSFPPRKSGALIWIRKYQIEKLKFHPFATPPQCGWGDIF